MINLILLITKDPEFSVRKQKIFKKIGYDNINVSSTEESIELLKKNKKISLAVIDTDTVENIEAIVNHIETQLFIPIIYTSKDIQSPQESCRDFCNISIPKDGSELLFQSSLETTIKLYEDIRECKKKCSEQSMMQNEDYKAIFNNEHVVMMIINSETKEIIEVNPAAVKFYGWSRKEMLEMLISDINSLKKDEIDKELHLAKTKKRDYFIFKHKIKNGNIKDVEVYSGPITIGGKTLLLSIIKDITQLKENENVIKKLAYYDYLTSLPNRRSFSDQLETSIESCKSDNSKLILLEIDIDYFKSVNDNFGHHVGDLLLKEIARRLENNVRTCNQVYRKGGDEFAIIINESLGYSEISKIGSRILSQLKKPLCIDENQVFVTASIGVAVYPDDGYDSETILKNSDLAMYKSKKDGGNTYNFFSEKIALKTKLKRDVESNLRKALIKKELKLYFQPKISLLKSEIIGSECLVRWIKDGKFYKAPGDFIPLAEASGLIWDLDNYVLTEACRQIKEWEESDLKGHKVSVNISGVHFKQKKIIETAKNVLKKFKIPIGAIEIEITEGIFLEDTEEAASTLIELKNLGFEISIDDFGTGYSSFKYLSQLPINRIKIDRSFIKDITSNKNNIAITQMIISMGKVLNLKVIAEGVETREQLNLLLENGCTEVQGYYFGKPMPVEEYEEFYRKNKPTLSN